MSGGVSTASGDVNVGDVDDAAHTHSFSGSATYGSFAITSGGVWTYTLDNADDDTQALKEGQSVSESFTATVTGMSRTSNS